MEWNIKRRQYSIRILLAAVTSIAVAAAIWKYGTEKPTVHLEGRVHDEFGRPVEGVTVTTSHHNLSLGFDLSTTTNNNGDYRLGPLGPGVIEYTPDDTPFMPVTVSATHPNYVTANARLLAIWRQSGKVLPREIRDVQWAASDWQKIPYTKNERRPADLK